MALNTMSFNYLNRCKLLRRHLVFFHRCVFFSLVSRLLRHRYRNVSRRKWFCARCKCKLNEWSRRPQVIKCEVTGCQAKIHRHCMVPAVDQYEYVRMLRERVKFGFSCKEHEPPPRHDIRPPLARRKAIEAAAAAAAAVAASITTVDEDVADEPAPAKGRGRGRPRGTGT